MAIFILIIVNYNNDLQLSNKIVCVDYHRKHNFFLSNYSKKLNYLCFYCYFK